MIIIYSLENLKAISTIKQIEVISPYRQEAGEVTWPLAEAKCPGKIARFHEFLFCKKHQKKSAATTIARKPVS